MSLFYLSLCLNYDKIPDIWDLMKIEAQNHDHRVLGYRRDLWNQLFQHPDFSDGKKMVTGRINGLTKSHIESSSHVRLRDFPLYFIFLCNIYLEDKINANYLIYYHQWFITLERSVFSLCNKEFYSFLWCSFVSP